jgi:hypothetical protein
VEGTGTYRLMCLVASVVLAGVLAGSAGASVKVASASCPNITKSAFTKRGFVDVKTSGGPRCTQADEVLTVLAATGSKTGKNYLGFSCTVKGSSVRCVDGKGRITARETK